MAHRSHPAIVEVRRIQEGSSASFATRETAVKTSLLDTSDVYLLEQMFLLLDSWDRAIEDHRVNTREEMRNLR